MIPNSFLPRKGENEIFFTHMGEVVKLQRKRGYMSSKLRPT